MSDEILKALSPLGLKASVAALEQINDRDGDRRDALRRQRQQLEYEAARAFDQYNQVDPAHRLVAEVLEQRWNETLAAVAKVNTELDAVPAAPQPLSRAETQTILALGENFAAVWNDPACSMVVKKKIVRTLLNEIIVDLDDDTQQLRLIIHWHGGCHTAFDMPKPLSGALAHKTTLEDRELITAMAPRYRDAEIARVLSKLGRRTGKGQRWTQTRVAYVRKKYALPAVNEAPLDTHVITLGQATKYCGVSDTTLMRLIREKILAAEQVVPYAPIEIKRADLDSDPVASILARLKSTGKLILEGDTLAKQTCLFDSNQ